MKPYSLDLRELIVAAYDRGEGSVRDLAEVFGVGRNTVQRYLTRRRLLGSVAPAPHGGGPRRALRGTDERALRALVRECNDRTDAEYATLLEARTRRHVSRRTINRTWQRLGYTRKAKVLHANERDRPDVRRKRRAFRQRARRRMKRRRAQRAPGRDFFVDEFGMHLGMTRRYARAPRGERAVGKVPDNPDPNVTLTMALSPRGVIAPWTFEGSTDGRAFETYIRTQLAPKLRRGDVVYVDGLGAHRSRAAREAVEARGATYEILPPYSPDFSPVEETGSKVKAWISGCNPRTRDALDDAIADALRQITPRDAKGWFSDRADYLSFRPQSTGPPL
jgi:transposase